MAYMYSEQTVAEHLSGVVQFATLSHEREELMDFEPFYQMHAYLEKAYPNIHATLEKEIIGKAGLLYHWKGTGKSNAKPLLFMAHQDGVPEGDHSKWTYPPYSGTVADGFVWGRGSSDCKTDMIAQLETIEYLIGQGFQPDYDIYLAYVACYEQVGSHRRSKESYAQRHQSKNTEVDRIDTVTLTYGDEYGSQQDDGHPSFHKGAKNNVHNEHDKNEHVGILRHGKNKFLQFHMDIVV